MISPIKRAVNIRVRGIVQGVGFRPFIFKLAQSYDLNGWVLNDESGVKIHIEGFPDRVSEFIAQLPLKSPQAARIENIEIEEDANCDDYSKFEIVLSSTGEQTSTRISPDLLVCNDCIADLENSDGRYFNYPYVNCTNCGPRFSIIKSLPYDRQATTMSEWKMCAQCITEYENVNDRRFHAQPVACPKCGPNYYLRENDETSFGIDAIKKCVQLLNEGKIVAIKGIGGYHLCCDATNKKSIQNLRERKYRKDKPFAVMVKDLKSATGIVQLDDALTAVLSSQARPITLAPSLKNESLSEDLAPDNKNTGVMLSYTPLHKLLFTFGAPELLVMTSANRSSEPISYTDEDALTQLDGIADAFLIGERAITRRIDDSVVASSSFGIVTHRRSRGYAPGAVTILPAKRNILALGADLKNTITLVVSGQAFVSQHIGDLNHVQSFRAMKATVADMVKMYNVDLNETVVVHDAHPSYQSAQFALQLPSHKTLSVQHHRAHIASVLAEKSAFEKHVVGIALDGTGYGDDGGIWGCEFFVGSLCNGFERTGHLLNAFLAGGDAAAIYPPQAAAGFLHLIETPDLTKAPFFFEPRFLKAQELVRRNFRCWPTSSMGRLFDTVAALCGFTREISFEAQAAIWLEHQAQKSHSQPGYPFFFAEDLLDWRPVLQQIITDRINLRPVTEIARAFHEGLATALKVVAVAQCEQYHADTVVLSGGVMQNELLLNLLHERFTQTKLTAFINHVVPANDGGISLGQAAMASFLA